MLTLNIQWRLDDTIIGLLFYKEKNYIEEEVIFH
jgi:hypothetical protein